MPRILKRTGLSFLGSILGYVVAHILFPQYEGDMLTVVQWARTEMGSEHADLDPGEAAECLISKVLLATIEDSGKFFQAKVPSWEYKGGPNRYEGQCLPW